MNKTASIDIKTAEKLVREIEGFEELKKHILKLLPEDVIPKGSNLWWEKEMLDGEEDIKKGNYTIVSDKKELMGHLDSLKKS